MTEQKHHKPFGKSPEIVRLMKAIADSARDQPRENMLQFLALYDSFVDQSIAMKEPMLIAGPVDDRFLLAAMGIAGEAGEVVDQFKKIMFHDHVPPTQMSAERRRAIIKEMGDKFWYDSLLLKVMGITWRDVMQANMDKLVGREEGTGE
jgi:NTP pyrophosphatase (non-canonical NTP hydrolase)